MPCSINVCGDARCRETDEEERRRFPLGVNSGSCGKTPDPPRHAPFRAPEEPKLPAALTSSHEGADVRPAVFLDIWLETQVNPRQLFDLPRLRPLELDVVVEQLRRPVGYRSSGRGEEDRLLVDRGYEIMDAEFPDRSSGGRSAPRRRKRRRQPQLPPRRRVGDRRLRRSPRRRARRTPVRPERGSGRRRRVEAGTSVKKRTGTASQSASAKPARGRRPSFNDTRPSSARVRSATAPSGAAGRESVQRLPGHRASCRRSQPARSPSPTS